MINGSSTLASLVWLACSACLLLTGPARAQEPADAQQATIDAAVEAHAAGRYAEARDQLEAALAIQPTARVLRALAMCEVELGELTDAYRTLARALVEPGTEGALSAEQRAHVESLLARVVSQIARVRIGESATIDDEAAAPAIDGWVPLAPGAHRVEVRTETATARAQITLAAGEAREIDELITIVVAPRMETPRLIDRATRVAIVEDPHLPEPAPQRDRDSAFIGSASGTIGGHDGGTGWYPAAGFVASLGALTRFTDDVSIGGTVSLAWSRLLDDRSASQTHTWLSVGLRLTFEIHPVRSPVAAMISIGGMVGTRARPDDGPLQRADLGVEIEVGPRFYVIEDVLFLGADLRVVTGGLSGADAALVIGARTL